MKRFIICIYLIEVFCGFSSQRYFVYVSENSGISNVVLYDISNSETRILTGFNDSGKIYSFSSTSDGSKIFLTRPSRNYGKENSTIWMINSDGSGLVDLVDISTTETILHVSVSPDNKKIVFTKNTKKYPDSYQIYLKDEAGNIVRLTNFDPNFWSSLYPIFIDNNKIIFELQNKSSNSIDICTINIDGTGLQNLTNNQFPYFPRIGKISLYGNKIIYGKQKNENGFYSNWGIYIYDIIKKEEIPVFENLYYGNIPPERQLDPQPVFISEEDILFIGTQNGTYYDLYLTNINSSNPYLQRITYSENPYLPYYFEIPYPLTKIVYSYENNIYLIDEKGEIKLFNPGKSVIFDNFGNWITYINNGIKIKRVEGGNEITVETDTNSKSPCFSSDGKWVLYIKNNDIYARKIDNLSYFKNLTNTPNIEKTEVVFSPDGTYLLYVGKINGKRYIFKLPVSLIENDILFGAPVNLTEKSYENYNPTISNDGNKIVFISTRNNIPELWEMDKNGSNQKKIIFSSNPPYYPSNPFFSSIDNYLYYLSDFPRKIYKVDLSSQFLSGEEVIYPVDDDRFSIGKIQQGIIDTKRENIYEFNYEGIPLKYKLKVNINKKYPNSFILEEIFPKEWALKEVKINGETINETNYVLTSETDTESRISIIFGTPGAHKVEDVVVELKFDISKCKEGDEYWVRGWTIDIDGRYITRGDSLFKIGKTYHPFDKDKDWEISDDELLTAIYYWVNNYQINGWPEDIENWDDYILQIINFWIKNGYKFDELKSKNRGEVVWD